jgi:AcrR family transcriptional regulator
MNVRKRAAPARRPRRDGEELRAAILDAAADVFLAAGYQGASIEAVIDKVGGSKRAIYSHFGGKKELFAALVTENSNKVLEGLSADGTAGLDLEATLIAFGRRVMQVVMAPRVLALYRVVVAEGARFPDIAQVFYESGPGRASGSLAKVLDRFHEQGLIEIEDSQNAAEHFMGVVRGDLHLRIVLGLRAPPKPAEIELLVRQAVTIFLNGVAGCETKTSGRPRQ